MTIIQGKNCYQKIYMHIKIKKFFLNSILQIQDLYMPKINQLVTTDVSPYGVSGVLYNRLLAWKDLHFLLPARTHNLLLILCKDTVEREQNFDRCYNSITVWHRSHMAGKL
jgi:hypothetical protein